MGEMPFQSDKNLQGSTSLQPIKDTLIDIQLFSLGTLPRIESPFLIFTQINNTLPKIESSFLISTQPIIYCLELSPHSLYLLNQ